MAHRPPFKIVSQDDHVGRFTFEGDPRSQIGDQIVGAYRCDCGHKECRTIGVACLSIHVDGNQHMQDTICMSPAAWRETVKRVQAILDKEFPFQ